MRASSSTMRMRGVHAASVARGCRRAGATDEARAAAGALADLDAAAVRLRRSAAPSPGRGRCRAARVVKNGSKMRSRSSGGTPGPESATSISHGAVDRARLQRRPRRRRDRLRAALASRPSSTWLIRSASALTGGRSAASVRCDARSAWRPGPRAPAAGRDRSSSAHRHRPRLQVQRAREGEQRGDHVVQPIDLGGDEGAGAPSPSSSGRHRLAEVLRGGADDGERVAHLVRDGGGELAERRELLALRQAHARRVDGFRLLADERALPADRAAAPSTTAPSRKPSTANDRPK